ncbi:MAG: hypothetical protein ACTTIC_02195 [Helicobacteraceae bacterium]
MIFININDVINDFSKPQVFGSYAQAEPAISADDTIFPVLEFREADLPRYQDAQTLGVIVDSVRDFLFLAKTKVGFALCSQDLAPTLQRLAQEYLLDIKVIAIIKESALVQGADRSSALSSQIEKIASHSIDGVILLEL